MENNNLNNDLNNEIEEVVEEKAISENFTKSCFEWIEALIPALIVSVLIITFAFRTFTVNGQSMENTLHDGERLIGRSLLYKPKNGDIVAVGPMEKLDDKIIIKRIIATEGQTLDINFKTGDVTVDGVVLNEPYIKDLTKRREGGEIPKVIPEGKVFVMGDNRNGSTDSRSPLVGLVSEDQIIAKAELIYWPLNRIGLLK